MMKKTRIESPHIVRSDDPARHFLVPEDYFPSLADDLLRRMRAEELAESGIREGGRAKRRRALSLTAAVAALLLIAPLVYTYTPLAALVEEQLVSGNSSTKEEQNNDLQEISARDYEDYLIEDWADDYYSRVLYSTR